MKRIKWLRYILYPPHCAVCGEILPLRAWRVAMLCGECEKRLPFLPRESCPHCGGKTEAGLCRVCRKEFAFQRGYAAFPYAAMRKSIHLYKFQGGKELGDALGRLMAQYLLTYHPHLPQEMDLILGVPLHPKKEKKRGFDQTRILCERLSAEIGLPYLPDGLSRKRHTAPQSLLSPKDKKENLRDAFGTERDFSGKRILLVDDIFTSGTTCNECAKVLLRAGAAEVCVFCLAAAGQRNVASPMPKKAEMPQAECELEA